MSLVRFIQTGLSTTKALPALIYKTSLAEAASFHVGSNRRLATCTGVLNQPLPTKNTLLQPLNPCVMAIRGMKVKGKLHLRCRGCYYEFIENRLHVNCTIHPRHKQAKLMRNTKKTWLLSHACQSVQRPY